VRAYWDEIRLVTRHGTRLHCPQWFVEGFPKNVKLDGELWMGRGTTYENLNRIINSKNGDWSVVGYFIFDLPSTPGTYEIRMKRMDELSLPSHVYVVKNTERTGIQHLYEHLEAIQEQKGEGIMLRKPQSPYTIGQTSSLLKVKVESVQVAFIPPAF